ncbi:MAG: restriction endonuclease [Burkholderiaceae bacterium]|nr:restriction endonuclease [Burkholderiaceae bacterium]
MAPNSLFAVLLRSPWWLSFALVGLIVLIAAAWLPSPYEVFGALGSLPIFGVGCVAAWRQLRAPSAAQVQARLDTAARLAWRDFSDQLARAWQAEGYAVQRLHGPATDLRLEKAGQVHLVSARRWKAAHHGIEPLRDLQAALAPHGAQTGVYVALQPLSEQAQALARGQGLVLLQGEALARLLGKASA